MLRLEHLRKSFGDNLAVDDLSLHVLRGEVLGLLGPNGAGKTTTLSIAVGLITPDSGTVDLDGQGSPTRPETRRRLGIAPQSIALYDDLSAEENLLLLARVYSIPTAAARESCDRLLKFIGLDDRRRDRVKTFSGGMKRRLNLAAGLVHDPPLVLLDEPTAGVDPQSRNAILDIVRALRAEGKTVVYTTHYMDEAQRVCDRVAIIDHGRLLALDTVDNLIAAHGGASVLTIAHRPTLLKSGPADPDLRIETKDPMAELLPHVKNGNVTGVRIDRPDLESVFLRLTGRSLRD